MAIQEQQMQGLDSIIEAISERVADKVCERMGDMSQNNDENLMTRNEVLEYLHITDATLWRWEREGLLTRAGQFGVRVYYKRSDVDKAMKEGKRKSK